jgi:MFS family permease
LISAAYPLGGLIGIFPAPYVADLFGRRAAIMVGALLIIAGGVIQTATSGGWAMLGGRLVVGLGSSFQVRHFPLHHVICALSLPVLVPHHATQY